VSEIQRLYSQCYQLPPAVIRPSPRFFVRSPITKISGVENSSGDSESIPANESRKSTINIAESVHVAPILHLMDGSVGSNGWSATQSAESEALM
jgi:hypothetical protein